MVHAIGSLTFGLSVVSLVLSTVGVWFSIRLAHRVGVMDVPNERSSHVIPMPRMGGIPMVGAATLAFGYWFFAATGSALSVNGLMHAMIFALAMSVLGFWDDLYGLSQWFRLFVQMVAASISVLAASIVLPEFAPGGWKLPSSILILVGTFWSVWVLNLYNFMDGIDGLAGGEAAVASSFFFLIFAFFGEWGWAAANLFIAAASMGFLVYNWPPARVFMGDAGSAFLGAFYGMQSVLALLATPVPFLVLVLPFSNFILDTTATLIRRVLRREKWYQAHRSHFYQRMTNVGISHRKVTVLELLGVAGSSMGAGIYICLGSFGRAVVVGVTVGFFISCGFWVRQKERDANLTGGS